VIHPVDAIAEQFVELLTHTTAAADRIFRDREPALDSRSELPAIVVHIGEDDPIDNQVHGRWRSEVRMNVDLFVVAAEDDISRSVLELRTEAYKALMADQTLGLPGVIRILPGGATEVLRGEGSLATGYLRTSFFVMYQHSLTDPTQ
jgi:hypothetical protein